MNLTWLMGPDMPPTITLSSVSALTPYALPLFAPLLMLSTAAAYCFLPRRRTGATPYIAEGAAIAGLLTAIGATGILIADGPGSFPGAGGGYFGLSVRLDAVSAPVFLLVAFIGWIVLRYSRTYLDGEKQRNAFIGWLCTTLASVQLLVISGTLLQLVGAWIATSLALHHLLLFYPDRLGAQRAARKKALFSTLSAVALILASALVWVSYGSSDITDINAQARAGQTSWIVVSASALFAIAALLKSAQFPTHGWLTEVMEAPTPVSALLHAGVINAGGFLLIRFADVMIAAPGVLAMLAIVGGFTALFGALVMLTQPAVKTSLAWSTIAQMGFMILQCGLALFPLALLHIIAHSFYKAHAFLASGNAVEQIAAARRPGPIAVPDGRAVVRAFVFALLIYAGIGAGFGLAAGFAHKSPQAFVLGTILIFGVAYLLAQGLADTAPRQLTRKTAAYASAAAIGYFALQTVAEWLTHGTIPDAPAPGRLEWTLMALSVLSFGFVAIAQALLPLWASHPAAAALRVHLSNGLYVNALLDRVLGVWATPKSK